MKIKLTSLILLALFFIPVSVSAADESAAPGLVFMTIKMFSVLAVVVGIIASDSCADVIYSNYGDGDTHSIEQGWAALYNVSPPYYPQNKDWDMGMSFVPNGSDYYVDTIELTAMHITGDNE